MCPGRFSPWESFAGVGLSNNQLLFMPIVWCKCLRKTDESRPGPGAVLLNNNRPLCMFVLWVCDDGSAVLAVGWVSAVLPSGKEAVETGTSLVTVCRASFFLLGLVCVNP